MTIPRRHKSVYAFLKLLAPIATRLFVNKINNFENLNKAKTFIIASNHSSYLDPVLLAAIYSTYFKRNIYFIGKRKLFRTFFGRIFHEAVGTIPLDEEDKGKAALETAKKYLQKCEIIGIFPEGRMSLKGELLKGKTGVARLAISARVPVLPIAIKGTYELMPIQNKFIPKFKKIVVINVGKLMYFSEYYRKPINKKILRTLTNKIMSNIKNLMKESD